MGCSAVPVDFLSHDQVIAYERFVGDLSRAELEGFFLLDATALDLIAHKRGAHNRLGVGLQIGTVAVPGALPDRGSPGRAVVGGGVRIRPVGDRDPWVVKRYTERRGTAQPWCGELEQGELVERSL
jgi:hypothetical protein